MKGMEANTDKEDIVLDVHKGEGDIIYLTVAGKITNDRLYAFVGWTEKVKKLVRETAEESSKPVLILTNATGVIHFESKSIVPLRELLDYNKQYKVKSAIVGANNMTRMLLEAVISFTERTNVKLFSTEKEALVWLREVEGPAA